MPSAASKYVPRYTVDDYKLWKGHWELWDGVPVAMSPAPTPQHQLIAADLFTLLRESVKQSESCDCFVLYETDWQIDASTVVRPDISVICNGLPEKYIDYAPAVIAEVLSPSTAGKDLVAKRALYAEEGVYFYLIADPEQKSLTVLELKGDRYEEREPDSNGSVTIEWGENCLAELSVQHVFRGMN